MSPRTLRLIREAAISQWMADNFEDWIEARMAEGWSEVRCTRFLKRYGAEIDRAYNELVNWLGGEDESLIDVSWRGAVSKGLVEDDASLTRTEKGRLLDILEGLEGHDV